MSRKMYHLVQFYYGFLKYWQCRRTRYKIFVNTEALFLEQIMPLRLETRRLVPNSNNACHYRTSTYADWQENSSRRRKEVARDGKFFKTGNKGSIIGPVRDSWPSWGKDWTWGYRGERWTNASNQETWADICNCRPKSQQIWQKMKVSMAAYCGNAIGCFRKYTSGWIT